MMKNILIFIILIVGSMASRAQSDMTYSSLNGLSSYDSLTVIYEGVELYTVVNNDSVEYHFINDTLTSTWVTVDNYEYYFNSEGKIRYYTYTEGNNQYCYFFEPETYMQFVKYPIYTIQDSTAGFGGFLSSGYFTTYYAGYTGNGCIDVYDADDTGLKWRVIVAETGYYYIKWRYSADDDDRHCRVLINSEVKTSAVDFADTGGWTTWNEDGTKIYLTKGLNIIKLIGNTSSSIPLIDYISLQHAGGGLVTPYREYTDPVAYAFTCSDIEEACSDIVDSIFIVGDNSQYSEGIDEIYTTEDYTFNITENLTLSGSGSSGNYINIMPCNFDSNVYLDCNIELSGDVTITGGRIKFTGVALSGRIEFK